LIDQNSETSENAKTKRRREAALKRMLSTPHKPHDESAGKCKAKQERRSAERTAANKI